MDWSSDKAGLIEKEGLYLRAIVANDAYLQIRAAKAIS